MEFIREKIKEKPINKKKVAMKVGVAALCGFVFALAACIVFAIAVPFIIKPEENEMLSSQEETEQEGTEQEQIMQEPEDTEVSSDSENNLVLPPDFNMSISDYETLQNELYEIGNRANTSIVTVTKMKNEDDWIMEENKSGTQGAGVIISQDDNYLYVLTERKIILEAPHIRVSFVDGTGAEATLFRYDANTGLAVLTVEKRLLKPDTKRVITVAKMGYMSMVKNGTLVIALGSPLETNYSILTGNITSVENKVMTKDKNYSIYTTDILASKNGSGILINTNGEVIGVVIQDFCGTQDVSTLTAVAINDISGIIEKMKAGKDIPYVGVYLSTVTDDIAKNYDIPKGVFVKEIVADSPAMKAGIQHGDVITHINGEVVQTDTVFSQKISQLIPGTSCEITLKRQNGNEYYEVKCTVTIGVLE